MKKNVISVILILCMLISVIVMLPITTSAATEGYYTYTVKNGEASITDYEDSISRDITIPDTLGGYPVTSIGNDAFFNCYNLLSITIPNSITSIGNSAFFNCDSLSSIAIPSSVTNIGNGVFYECSGLKSIDVSENNQYYCSLNGVLFDKAFKVLIQYPDGKENSEYIIPDGITEIGIRAFDNCYSLTNITIPKSVTSIGGAAFDKCKSLTHINLPNCVTTIGDCAFDNCINLISITIPKSVTSIGDDAFYYCTSLANVYYGGNKTDWSAISIGEYNENLINSTIHYNINHVGENHILSNVNFTQNTLSANLNVNNTVVEQNSTVIVAFYDKNGKLVHFKHTNISIKPGKIDVNIPIENKSYSSYKLMVWDGFNNLNPVLK